MLEANTLCCRLILTLILALIAFSQSASARSETGKTADHEMINWLPTDVETLVVARRPFLVRQFSEAPLSLHSLTLRGLDDLIPSLKGKTVLVSIEACRDFWFPGGNDTNIDEGCHLYLFREALNLDLKDLPGKLVRFDDTDVLLDSKTVGAGSMESYIAIPKKNLLVSTSSKRFMSTLLKRMKNQSPDRAMPSSLPEWNFVSKDSGFYAIRHYEKISEDPMSPHAQGSMWDAYGCADKEAIGFAVSASSYTPSKINCWYLSKNIAGVKTVAIMFSDDENLKDVTYKLVSDNCWKVEVSSKNRWHTLLQVMAMLGHTPYF